MLNTDRDSFGEFERTGTFRAPARPTRQREVWLIAAFWLLFALVTCANRLLDPRRPDPSRDIWIGTIATSGAQALLWAVLTIPLFALVARVNSERMHRAVQLLMLCVATLGAALIVSTLVDQVRNALFPLPRFGLRSGPITPLARPWWSFSLGGFQFLNDVIIAMGVVAAGFARAFSLSSSARQEQSTRLKAQLAEARLDALRRQLDPHFLFNTLHAVSSLVERDPRGVRRMITRLSELLRHSFEDADEPEIPLRRELDLLTRYVEIMQVRFQGRLEVSTHVAPDAAQALVPNLILQPLVENAIRHGTEQLTTEGKIDVEISRDGDVLILRVRDNGPGPHAKSAASGSGLGVRNTMARLEQLYGTAQSFVLRRGDDGGAVVEVRLPFHTPADLRTVAAT